ncbi:hypothetical protein H2203_002995 [Taxawa tesnikishii (nom. ined.)]|nr:hypothetical protein H2203_002995 [Dothideales sp. JES 119]
MATVSNLLLQVPSDHTEDVSATISRAPTPGFSDSESGDEGSVVSTAATSVVSLPDKEEPLPSRSSSQIAESILDVLQMFGQHLSADGIDSWTGRAMFFGSVHKRVEAGQPIKMVLPSFPWKSINRVHKGIGSLPDLAEELALSRLDHLCREIEKVYAGGAEVTIATDGLIFDDVVGITDDDTWSYGEALMDLCAEKCFSHIRLVRAMELLGYTSGQQLTKEKYFALAQKCREALLTKEFCRTEEYVRAMMKEDADTMSTYLGFIRFLETDLKYSPVAKDAASGHKYRKIVKKVAIGMVIRAESFTKLLQSKCAGYIRLSIHPSGGAVKLSVPLIPQADGAFPAHHGTVPSPSMSMEPAGLCTYRMSAKFTRLCTATDVPTIIVRSLNSGIGRRTVWLLSPSTQAVCWSA